MPIPLFVVHIRRRLVPCIYVSVCYLSFGLTNNPPENLERVCVGARRVIVRKFRASKRGGYKSKIKSLFVHYS